MEDIVVQCTSMPKTLEAELYNLSRDGIGDGKRKLKFLRNQNGLHPSCTHMLVTPKLQELQRTEKLLASIASGRVWILSSSWLMGSLRAKRILLENPYDLSTSKAKFNHFHVAPFHERKSMRARGGVFKGWKVVVLITDIELRHKLSRILQCGGAVVHNWTLRHFLDDKKTSLSSLTHLLTDPLMITEPKFTQLLESNEASAKPIPIVSYTYVEECLMFASKFPDVSLFYVEREEMYKMHYELGGESADRAPHDARRLGSPTLSVQPDRMAFYGYSNNQRSPETIRTNSKQKDKRKRKRNRIEAAAVSEDDIIRHPNLAKTGKSSSTENDKSLHPTLHIAENFAPLPVNLDDMDLPNDLMTEDPVQASSMKAPKSIVVPGISRLPEETLNAPEYVPTSTIVRENSPVVRVAESLAKKNEKSIPTLDELLWNCLQPKPKQAEPFKPVTPKPPNRMSVLSKELKKTARKFRLANAHQEQAVKKEANACENDEILCESEPEVVMIVSPKSETGSSVQGNEIRRNIHFRPNSINDERYSQTSNDYDVITID